jgi:hypothetical protein
VADSEVGHTDGQQPHVHRTGELTASAHRPRSGSSVGRALGPSCANRLVAGQPPVPRSTPSSAATPSATTVCQATLLTDPSLAATTSSPTPTTDPDYRPRLPTPTTDPDYPTTDPDYPTTDPDYPTTDPDYPTTDPDYPTTDPDYRPRLPDYPTTDPDYQSDHHQLPRLHTMGIQGHCYAWGSWPSLLSRHSSWCSGPSSLLREATRSSSRPWRHCR